AAMPTEFDLIEAFLQWQERPGKKKGVAVGPGDDCAVLDPAPDRQLVVSTDAQVEGVHFPPGLRSDIVGYRSIAVSLSDLAASGASARYVTICLTLPAGDKAWIEAFAKGVALCCEEHGVSVIGGYLARGSVQVSVAACGSVARGPAWVRSGARAGDDLWMSGRIGATALALDGFGVADLPSLRTLRSQRQDGFMAAFLLPCPRLAIVSRLDPHVHAAIDLSDGLAGEVHHLARQSSLKAMVDAERIPIWPGADLAAALESDDSYELLLAAPRRARSTMESLTLPGGLPLSRIGEFITGSGVEFRSNRDARLGRCGHEHF
ncbi:MAG: thiamine-phosphate kinase, partial [Pseudomonadales bacterium]|nr:thiamine-phosphate kinase [Pseudomonadales bacterium]